MIEFKKNTSLPQKNKEKNTEYYTKQTNTKISTKQQLNNNNSSEEEKYYRYKKSKKEIKTNEENSNSNEKDETEESNYKHKITKNPEQKKSPTKNNIVLQEKLKKILMGREKEKFEYTKQKIPEYLKYRSDDSESSEISAIKTTSKIKTSEKKENKNVSNKQNNDSSEKKIPKINSNSNTKKLNSEEKNNSPNVKYEKDKKNNEISNNNSPNNNTNSYKKIEDENDEEKKQNLQTVLEKIRAKKRESEKSSLKNIESEKKSEESENIYKEAELEKSIEKKRFDHRRNTHTSKHENLILPKKIYRDEENDLKEKNIIKSPENKTKTKNIIYQTSTKTTDFEKIKKLKEDLKTETKSNDQKFKEKISSTKKELNTKSNMIYDRKKSLNIFTSGNIYCPKKAGMRGRSLEKNEISETNNNKNKNKVIPNCNGKNSSGNIFATVNNNQIGGAYTKKRSPIREKSKIVQMNNSFCGYENECNNKNIVNNNNYMHGRNNISSLEMENQNNNLNSSFDACMKNYGNNNSNLLVGINSNTNLFSNDLMKNFYESVKYMNNFNYINNINLNNNSFYDLRPPNLMNYDPNTTYTTNYTNRLTNYSTNTLNLINNSYLGMNNSEIQKKIAQQYNIIPNNFNTMNSINVNPSINIEDLLVLEEKLNEIIIILNKTKIMYNECFEFWNYFYNCSLYEYLDKLFSNIYESNNVKISINFLLLSIMICYEFSFELNCLNNAFSVLNDLLQLNHKNLIILYEYILTKISSESRDNIWVLKLRNMVNSSTSNDINYNIYNGYRMSPVDKISYNTGLIVQNIRLLLKNFKTQKIENLTSIFKKINELSYEEINIFFREWIFHVDNMNGSVLASIFLKENNNFKTEPAPYLKTINRKPYSLILDLDETLVHFKVNPENENEGVLRVRPGITEFLDKIDKYYELIIFTAATQDYADLLIDAIEENKIYFEHRLYRQHTVIIDNDFIKDLTRIGRPLDKIAIVDNMPQNFRLQKENGINIKAFWGEEIYDTALIDLAPILISIAKEGGDIRIGLAKYKDEIVKKVTSNISKNNQ